MVINIAPIPVFPRIATWLPDALLDK